MYEWKNGWMNGRMGGWRDVEEWMDGGIEIKL